MALAHTLRTSVDKGRARSDEAFCDKGEGLCCPYPGLPTSPDVEDGWRANCFRRCGRCKWRASPDVRAAGAAEAQALADRDSLAGAGETRRDQDRGELGGFDGSGQDVVSSRSADRWSGQGDHDDAVIIGGLPRSVAAEARLTCKEAELGVLSQGVRHVPLLRAFERVGATHLTELAMAFTIKKVTKRSSRSRFGSR